MKNQLVSFIHNFEIWDYYSYLDEKLKFVDADNLPFIRYPNRIPCFEVNLYMQMHLHKGSSRRVNGGTLRTYAYNISHLVRYCFKNKIHFSNLNDDRFKLFIRGLQGEVNFTGDKIRNNNQVIKIGRQCIDFLIFVRNLYDLNGFIGVESGNSIHVIKKKNKRFIKGNNRAREISYYSHRAFPSPDVENKRHPISNDAAVTIRKTILEQTNRDIRKRDLCIYQTLEQTGARRTEVTLLKVDDIKNALNSSLECPLLHIITLKRRSQSYRMLPVTRIFLSNLNDYILTTRRKIIKKTIGIKRDHGYLFISHTTGEPLKPDTISTYMALWRKKSGLKEKAFAHLFRHSFITEKLKCMILNHNIENQDEFRKTLLNTERFKIQLKEWTGHTNLYSLNTYIDLAFSDLDESVKVYDTVSLTSSVKIMQNKIDEIQSELLKGDTSTQDIITNLQRSLDAFSIDVEKCGK